MNNVFKKAFFQYDIHLDDIFILLSISSIQNIGYARVQRINSAVIIVYFLFILRKSASKHGRKLLLRAERK